MKKILVNREPWQTRVAVLDDDGRLQDLYFESRTKEELERCFFKARVSKVLPGIQTAFVDIGQKKAGFLHISEVDHSLALEKFSAYEVDHEGETKAPSKSSRRANVMDVSKIFKEGEDILVQVIKEPVYEKGAKLTTCFALPGKFIVLMPNIPQIGVSRKIEKQAERERLKTFVSSRLPEGMGAIIRTTTEGRSEEDIGKDLAMLISVWQSIQKRYAKAVYGEKVHEDLSLALRTIREHLDDDVEAIICDSEEDIATAQKFIKYFMPDKISLLRLYTDKRPLFDHCNVEQQIDPLLNKKVELKSGGSLIIEAAEAMTVIDVNTGKFIGKDDQEVTILKTNIEAAEEVVRQLRLRNIGGLIVIDFIDMYKAGNRQKLSRVLQKTLKEKDKLQSVALKISEFGLVQMTRKRSGKTLIAQLTENCNACRTLGVVKSASTHAYDILRKFVAEISKKDLVLKEGNFGLVVSQRVFDYLVKTEFSALIELEKHLGHKILLESSQSCCDDEYQLKLNEV